jgi:hypothetical protein
VARRRVSAFWHRTRTHTVALCEFERVLIGPHSLLALSWPPLGWVLVYQFSVHFLRIGRFQAVYLGSPNQKHCAGARRPRSCYLGVGLPPYQRGDCNVCHRTRQHNQDLEGGILRMRAPVAFSSTQQHTAARAAHTRTLLRPILFPSLLLLSNFQLKFTTIFIQASFGACTFLEVEMRREGFRYAFVRVLLHANKDMSVVFRSPASLYTRSFSVSGSFLVKFMASV